MLIDRIELYLVAMPLLYPWRTACGEDATIESVLVKMYSGDTYGWGESTPMAAPFYSPDWAAGIFHLLQNWLAPRVVGQHLSSGEELGQQLSVFKGNHFAKAALDTAWWTLHARKTGKPLYRALGGRRNIIDVGADFGVMDSLDDLVKSVGKANDAGFKRIKLKFRPGWDLDMVEAVRSTFPKLAIHVDCNSAYRLADKPLFQKLDRFDLAMIEQPLTHDDLADHAVLAKSIQTPICLDESITSIDRARHAIDMESCRWVNIKPGRVGGLTNARSIHDLCRQAEVPCWVGGMLESAVGSSLCIALATLDNFSYPADIFPSSRFYKEDLADPPVKLTDTNGYPQVVATEDPGIGPEPSAVRLEQCCLQRGVVTDDERTIGK